MWLVNEIINVLLFLLFNPITIVGGGIYLWIKKTSGYKCPDCGKRTKDYKDAVRQKKKTSWRGRRRKDGGIDRRYKQNTGSSGTTWKLKIKCSNISCGKIFFVNKTLYPQDPDYPKYDFSSNSWGRTARK